MQLVKFIISATKMSDLNRLLICSCIRCEIISGKISVSGVRRRSLITAWITCFWGVFEVQTVYFTTHEDDVHGNRREMCQAKCSLGREFHARLMNREKYCDKPGFVGRETTDDQWSPDWSCRAFQLVLWKPNLRLLSDLELHPSVMVRLPWCNSLVIFLIQQTVQDSLSQAKYSVTSGRSRDRMTWGVYRVSRSCKFWINLCYPLIRTIW